MNLEQVNKIVALKNKLDTYKQHLEQLQLLHMMKNVGFYLNYPCSQTTYEINKTMREKMKEYLERRIIETEMDLERV